MTLLERYGLPPDEIEARSLALVERALLGSSPWSGDALEIAKRMVYAAGDLELARAIRIHPAAPAAGIEALAAGRPLVCDVRMVEVGLSPLPNEVRVAIAQRAAPDQATASRSTRAAEGMRLLTTELDGGVAIVGNAPTALLALLDMVDAGLCRPAIVIGTPVGFVAAAESKQELMRRDLPHVSVEGTRGGSAIAAAAANALIRLARLESRQAPTRDAPASPA